MNKKQFTFDYIILSIQAIRAYKFTVRSPTFEFLHIFRSRSTKDSINEGKKKKKMMKINPKHLQLFK